MKQPIRHFIYLVKFESGKTEVVNNQELTPEQLAKIQEFMKWNTFKTEK